MKNEDVLAKLKRVKTTTDSLLEKLYGEKKKKPKIDLTKSSL
jgi:hypothetical protein